MSVLQIRATDRIFIKLRWVFLPFCVWYCYLWVQNEMLSLSCGNCLPRCIQIELNWTEPDDGIMLFLMHFRYDDGNEHDENDEVIVAEVSSFASKSNKVIGRINSKHCSQNSKVILRKIIRWRHLLVSRFCYWFTAVFLFFCTYFLLNVLFSAFIFSWYNSVSPATGIALSLNNTTFVKRTVTFTNSRSGNNKWRRWISYECVLYSLFSLFLSSFVRRLNSLFFLFARWLFVMGSTCSSNSTNRTTTTTKKTTLKEIIIKIKRMKNLRHSKPAKCTLIEMFKLHSFGWICELLTCYIDSHTK